MRSVESGNELRSVDGELTTHAVTIFFHDDGARYDSVSTLRFRSREVIEVALERSSFAVREVRDTRVRTGPGLDVHRCRRLLSRQVSIPPLV